MQSYHHGALHSKNLRNVSKFFVQNSELQRGRISKELENIGFNQGKTEFRKATFSLT